MILIIDGYNLLFAPAHQAHGALENKQADFKQTVLEKAREKLIHLIKLYNQHRKYKIILVFDGANPSRSTQRSSQIEIIFSGAEEKADEVIIELARRQTNPRQVTVVTSDRHIKQHLKPIGVETIDSSDFIKELIISSPRSKKAETFTQSKMKLFGISADEAKGWLKIFGIE